MMDLFAHSHFGGFAYTSNTNEMGLLYTLTPSLIYIFDYFCMYGLVII
jgi:hypothetical protein